MTPEYHNIKTIMGQIGPLLDLEQVVAFEEENNWILFFTPQLSVDIEYAENLHSVVITADLMSIDHTTEKKIYELLLEYNFLCIQTGGIRVAIDRARSQLVFMLTLKADMDLAHFCSVIGSFKELLMKWRSFLDKVVTSSQKVLEPSGLPDFMLKV